MPLVRQPSLYILPPRPPTPGDGAQEAVNGRSAPAFTKSIPRRRPGRM